MALLVTLAVLVGLALGSFANVVISRVPAGGSVVSPPSACPKCGHGIRSRHNVPVIGWLVLGGKCYDCREPISARYPVIEALTGAAFGLVVWGYGLSWTAGLLLILTAFTVVLSMIDFDTQRLPDAITRPFALVVALYLVAWALVDGDWSALGRAAIGTLALGAFYFVVWFIYPKGMGFGDVKLAPTLGAVLAWFGWAELIVGGFSAFAWGALLGVAAMIATRKGRKLAIPFGPWMFAGAWTGLFVGPAIAEWYLALVGLQ